MEETKTNKAGERTQEEIDCVCGEINSRNCPIHQDWLTATGNYIEQVCDVSANETPLAFLTFRIGQVKFLAVAREPRGFSILDETGNNYGLWDELDSFKTKLREGDPLTQSLGKASIAPFKPMR